MYTLNDIKQLLNLDNQAIKQLEGQFKTSLTQALLNFGTKAEAIALLKRKKNQRIIDRRTVYHDFNNNRGGAPTTYWKKECPYCRAAFEATNHKKIYCEAPGHRQRYHEQEKSAKLFIYLSDQIENQASTRVSKAPSRTV